MGEAREHVARARDIAFEAAARELEHSLELDRAAAAARIDERVDAFRQAMDDPALN